MSDDQVQCPNCGSFATQPVLKGFLETLGAFGKYGTGSMFRYPQYLKKFKSGQIEAVCENCEFTFSINTVVQNPAVTGLKASQISDTHRTTQERLTELEQIRMQGLVTEEEYKRKRTEILRGL